MNMIKKDSWLAARNQKGSVEVRKNATNLLQLRSPW